MAISSQKSFLGTFSSFLGKFLGTRKCVNHGLYRHFHLLPQNRFWENLYVNVQSNFALLWQIIFALYKRVLNQQFAKSSTLYFYFSCGF